jgi:hypothetical protein
MADGKIIETKSIIDSELMAPNFVTASTDTGVLLLVNYSPHGVTPRPRWNSLTVRVSGGYLSEGDRIIIVFGDTSQGSPGMKMQTCAEKAFPDAVCEPVREAMMGDILQSSEDSVTLNIEAIAQAPIERIEVRNGTEVIKILRGYREKDLGERIRIIWSGAEYRGRGRETQWTGHARFGSARILRTRKINAWNREHAFDQHGADSITWKAVTTGNFGGFDAWIEPRQPGDLHIVTNLGSMKLPLTDVGLEDIVMDAGGLERSIRVFRLPETNPHREIRAEVDMPLNSVGDNPLWICVTTEDGFQAWSSPIFIFR